ncbi:hypothetical protein E1A91_D11G075900v1 [Gossypium mustelinum]|uniref:Uncharacterized protein n=1 Tax=Gossypium mustelinum TaxID=34275 RepID=A0A5D2SPR1_GOSMU|nr:hypothetical protein E1A91_D11G075900v1 [Gossypium mustelinum]
MSCKSHCPRKERRRRTRSDSREISVSRKSVSGPASRAIPTSEKF